MFESVRCGGQFGAYKRASRSLRHRLLLDRTSRHPLLDNGCYADQLVSRLCGRIIQVGATES